MSEKLYGQRDAESDELRELYMKHLDHMTREGLFLKSAIAKELAFRDAQLAALRAENEKLREERRWIPISERLPATDVRVLLRPRAFQWDIDFGRLNTKKMFYNDNWHRDVAASEFSDWMPSPATVPAPDTATGAAKGVEGA